MASSEIEQVLRNWLVQATSNEGRLPDGIAPMAWVADHFMQWWRKQVDDSLGAAEYAALCLREELTRLDDATRLGAAFHELTHIQDALSDLRSDLGLAESTE